MPHAPSGVTKLTVMVTQAELAMIDECGQEAGAPSRTVALRLLLKRGYHSYFSQSETATGISARRGSSPT